MYLITLIHEFGHAYCIRKIAKKYGFDDKPIIIIGHKFDFDNLNDCLNSLYDVKFHKSKIFNNVLYYKFFTKNGITLYPHFEHFSDDEIIKCAKAGYRMELLFSFILIPIVIISIALCIHYFNCFNFGFMLIFCFIDLFLFLSAIVTMIKSSDKNLWENPKSIKSLEINQCFDLIKERIF